MEYQIETSGETETLKLSGELTIQFAAKLHGLLLEIINKAKTVRIQIENVTDADLSCLQLLCSAHRTASESDKNFSLNIGASEIFEQRMKEAGFGRTRGCTAETEKACLWIGGACNE